MVAATPIATESVSLAGVRTLLRRTDGAGTPTVFVHGNPTHSADWIPFLEACEGPALAFDLPNFGRSERLEAGRFDASMGAYSEWITSALDDLGIDDYKLVVHDWGGIALNAAQRDPRRLIRLVVLNTVPLFGDYRWHWVARIWRRRRLGELFNRAVTRRGLSLALRQARPGWRPMPPDFVGMVWRSWDRGMAAAVLSLYRSADPSALGEAGRGLGELACPALVLWGKRDPYIGAQFAGSYARALPNAELELLDGAGHWSWIDRPEVVDRVASFLG